MTQPREGEERWIKEFDERFHDNCWQDGEYEKESVKSFIRSLLAEREGAIKQRAVEMVEGMKKVVNYHLYSDPLNTIETSTIGNNPQFTTQPLSVEHYPHEYGYNQALADVKEKLTKEL